MPNLLRKLEKTANLTILVISSYDFQKPKEKKTPFNRKGTESQPQSSEEVFITYRQLLEENVDPSNFAQKLPVFGRRLEENRQNLATVELVSIKGHLGLEPFQDPAEKALLSRLLANLRSRFRQILYNGLITKKRTRSLGYLLHRQPGSHHLIT